MPTRVVISEIFGVNFLEIYYNLSRKLSTTDREANYTYLHFYQDLSVFNFNHPRFLYDRCVGVFFQLSYLIIQEKARQIKRETVNGNFHALTNISKNFQKIPGSIKFVENLQRYPHEAGQLYIQLVTVALICQK